MMDSQEIQEVNDNVRVGNFEDVEVLRRALISDDHNRRGIIPGLLREILSRREWMHRLDPDTDEPYDLLPHEFRRFITDPPRLGLGQDLARMKAEFCKTPELLDLWDRTTVGDQENLSWKTQPRTDDGSFVRRHSDNVTVAPHKETPTEHLADPDLPDVGRHQSNRDNVTVPYSGPERGNSEQYALRKLRAAAPELHARVLAGEISAHAAMREAGFRKSSIVIILDPVAAARQLVKHFTREQFAALVAAALDAYGAGDHPQEAPHAP